PSLIACRSRSTVSSKALPALTGRSTVNSRAESSNVSSGLDKRSRHTHQWSETSPINGKPPPADRSQHVSERPSTGFLTVDELRQEVAAGLIDTVLLAVADMQGRLQGKRLSARHFLDEVLHHGSEGCNYLLAVDVDMNTVGGYAMSSWDRGYGDYVMRPDLSTLRRVPWQEGTALLLADLAWPDGAEVAASPRQILRRQLARLAERGVRAYAGTELEFVVYEDSYEEAWKRAYRGLTPANLYNVDYSLLGTARVEPLLRRIRRGMEGAGLYVESAKGECNLGQHEITFRYAEALVTCDNHAVYKNGAKEI